MTESLRFRLSGWRGPVLIAVSLQVAVVSRPLAHAAKRGRGAASFPWTWPRPPRWNLSFKSLQEAKAVYAEHYRSK